MAIRAPKRRVRKTPKSLSDSENPVCEGSRVREPKTPNGGLKTPEKIHNIRNMCLRFGPCLRSSCMLSRYSYYSQIVEVSGERCKRVTLTRNLGPTFFCFSLSRASCMRPAGKKKRKKNTLSTRGCSFLGTTEHERGPYTHATRQKTHTEHERVQF